MGVGVGVSVDVDVDAEVNVVVNVAVGVDVYMSEHTRCIRLDCTQVREAIVGCCWQRLSDLERTRGAHAKTQLQNQREIVESPIYSMTCSSLTTPPTHVVLPVYWSSIQ